jgi:hypothetical protein
MLGIAVLSLLALSVQLSNPPDTLSDVTGRVTYSGRPLTGAAICLQSENGNQSAVGKLGSDGTFRLRNMKDGRAGAVPGVYHAFLAPRKESTSLPAKFRDPRTSGLEIEIASGWSDLNIDLH